MKVEFTVLDTSDGDAGMVGIAVELTEDQNEWLVGKLAHPDTTQWLKYKDAMGKHCVINLNKVLRIRWF